MCSLLNKNPNSFGYHIIIYYFIHILNTIIFNSSLVNSFFQDVIMSIHQYIVSGFFDRISQKEKLKL